ncbi:hypothetical protein LUZ60_012272 [Juncus effusus]|nr:hypothetical protein LUZ60_012272 [Juncus effusus]
MPALLNYRGKEDVCTRGFPFLHFAPSLYHPPCKRSRVTAPFCFTIDEELQLFKTQIHQQKTQPSIDSLPDECLFEILRRLAGARERCASACVSKRFLSLLTSIKASEIPHKTKLPDLNEAIKVSVEDFEGESDACLTRSLEGKQATDLRLAAISIGAASRGGLSKLLIKSSNKVTDSGLSSIANQCGQLRVLSLWNVPNVTDGGLTAIAQNCPDLEKLDLTGCPQITDKTLIQIAKKCPNLKSLIIESCQNIANEGLKFIGQSCPKVNSVNIKNCPKVEDSGISSLVSSLGPTSLTKVKLQNLNITDNSVSFIGYYCKTLTDLTLSSLNLVGEKGFWVMANALGLQNLASLAVNSCAGLTDLALSSLSKCCPALKTVSIRKSCLVSDAGLKNLAESARLLETLNLEECNRVSLNGILASLFAIGPKFKNLSLVKCLGVKDVNFPSSCQIPTCPAVKTLTINNCPGLTDASLAMIGKICPNLENVDLSQLADVSDFGLIPLIENCAGKLVKVNLSSNVNLTDVAISRLVKLNGNSLKLLNLEGCKNLTDKILLEISESCTVLDELDLSGSEITDYGIAVIVSARDLKLRVLSLASCRNVSGQSFPFLGNLGRNLQGLNLQSCNVSNINVASLENKLWWCDILY